jgi:hypothetical protein
VNGWVVDSLDEAEWAAAIVRAVRGADAYKPAALRWARAAAGSLSVANSADLVAATYERLARER